MKNKSVQNCRFVHHAKLHCIVTTLNRLFKIEFERGDWKRAKFRHLSVFLFSCVHYSFRTDSWLCFEFNNPFSITGYFSSLLKSVKIAAMKTVETCSASFSSLVVPTFDTKVTEYLCSGWVFFSSDKFRLFN